MSESDDLRSRLSAALGMELDRVSFIQANAYCRIYRAETGGRRVIVKQYRDGAAGQAMDEARAVDLYHEVAAGVHGLTDGRTLAANEAQGVICEEFVEGERMTEVVRRGARDAQDAGKAVRLMSALGALLARLRRRTARPGLPPAAFHFEYMAYCSRRLQDAPLAGALLFRGARASAERLSDAYRASGEAPSFAHGDFVFRNIHVDGERLGLIDFANAVFASHTLNDAYNLNTALAHATAPGAYQRKLREAFVEGLGGQAFSEAAHEFFYEYHRRRWLMLKLRTRNPLRWAQAARALAVFARPYEPGRALR